MNRETEHTRRRILRTFGSVAVAGLAGCNALDSGQQPTATPTETTATPTETATQEPTPTQTDSTEHATPGPPDAVDFAENPADLHPTLVEATDVAADEILIGLRLEDSSLPFTTEVYHAPADADVHTTRTYDTQDLSQVGLVPESKRTLDTVDIDREDIHYGTTTVGEPLTVTLVARHNGETFDWSSWERTGHPYDGNDGENPALNVDCYCDGTVYTAPSGGTWARVIQVTPTERVAPGTTVLLNWTSSRLRR